MRSMAGGCPLLRNTFLILGSACMDHLSLDKYYFLPHTHAQAWQKDYPLLRDTFLILETKGWRPPKINETCCARPSLAALLRDGGCRGRYGRGAHGGWMTGGAHSRACCGLLWPGTGRCLRCGQLSCWPDVVHAHNHCCFLPPSSSPLHLTTMP